MDCARLVTSTIFCQRISLVRELLTRLTQGVLSFPFTRYRLESSFTDWEGREGRNLVCSEPSSFTMLSFKSGSIQVTT
jgi:hypothetical protein